MKQTKTPICMAVILITVMLLSALMGGCGKSGAPSQESTAPAGSGR